MRFLIFVFFSFFVNSLFTQKTNLGFHLSSSNYSGDITPSGWSILKQTSPGIGLNITYEIDPYFSLRLGYEFLKIYANDKEGKEEWQKSRNLNFSSLINSFDLSGMINLKNLLVPNFETFNVFAVGGYTLFTYNPTSWYNQKKIELRNLGTEGQGMTGYKNKYSTWSSALNFGLNVQVFLTKRFSFETQFLFRKTNTDYLDDLSSNYVDYNILAQQNGSLAAELGNKIKAPQGAQRGNPGDKDWFQSWSFGIQYRFGSIYKIHIIPAKRKIVNCPKI
ncbi:MAG: outer membrane beta-barrel protein [Saprospiraceae bacterium]|nr:outer membrane beta-barrel protein [Saprospiraceae bacterium]